MQRGSADRPVRLVLTPAAAADLDEAFAYVSSERVEAAEGLLSRFRHALEQLRQFPMLGVAFVAIEDEPLRPGARFIVVEPYLVFYRVLEDAIVILRILHARRDSLGELLG